ncbi:MAG: serine/threonine-protein kinase [Balneolaceae bacterium]
MTKKHWRQILSIVDKALDLAPANRKSFVDEECKNNPLLRDEVHKFLDSIDTSEVFWDSMLESSNALVNELTSSGSDFDKLMPLSPLKQAGSYKVVKLIARGGMSDVYLGERSDGQFQRQAVIKILRKELVSNNHIKLFFAEREILSSLEHSNIARLYDAGIEDDRPYFIMEYVEGKPITEFCRENNCSFESKIELFKQVSSAINYAHRNLIVHRDLKPDNIFVKPDGTVKILDFGIAKVIDEEISEVDTGPRLMSIQYAAPEQVTHNKITTSTDVYALGLLLYELLTGFKPFNLEGKKLTDVELIIQYENPVKPSLRISNSTLLKKIKGDWDAIILTSLKKEPEHRYSSVDKLLFDISCYESQIPIRARKHSLSYVSSTFIARRKKEITIFAVLFITITGMLAIHYSEIQKQKNIALEGQEQAEFVTDFMVDLFNSASPRLNMGDTLTVYDLLEKGGSKIDTLDENFSAKPNLLMAVASSHTNLGNYRESIDFYEQAYEIVTSTNKNSLEHSEVAIAMGKMYSTFRVFDRAAEYFEEAYKIIEERGETNISEKIHDMNISYANVMSELGESDKSIDLLEESLEYYNRFDGGQDKLYSIKLNLAKTYRHNLDYEKSESLYRELIAEIDQFETSRESGPYVIYNNLAYLLKIQGKTEESIEYYNNAYDSYAAVYGEDHPNALMILNNLSAAYLYLNNHPMAETILKETLQLVMERYDENHWRVGTAHNTLGIFYLKRESFEQAEDMFEKATNIYIDVLGDHSWTAISATYLAFCQTKNGQDGDQLFQNAYTVFESHKGDFNHDEKNKLDGLIDNIRQNAGTDWQEKLVLLEELM